MPYKLVCFDFDHTLTQGKTAAEHVSDLLGCSADVDNAEDMFRNGRMTTSEFTDAMAHTFAGRTIDEIENHMLSIPLVSEISSTVTWLKARGLRVVINTVGFRDLLVPIGKHYGFDCVSGAQLEQSNGCFTGEVDAYFPLEDKIKFARDQAAIVGARLSEVIAVGDGLSDLPLFQNVGRSIAFNAPDEVSKTTHAVINGTSCAPLLPVFDAFLGETT